MAIIVRLDVMLAKRKMKGKDLAVAIGISEQNLSLLRSGKVRGERFETLSNICAVLDCQPRDLLDYEKTPRIWLLEAQRTNLYSVGMTRIFDMDDKTRLPWRFHGERLCILGDL